MTAADTPLSAADEIRREPAGPRLDARVARTLGLGWAGGNPIPGLDGRWPWPPPYSTEIAAALSPLDGWPGDCELRRQNGQWYCQLFVPSMQWDAWGETLPLAVCRARLIARLSNDR